MTDRSSLGHGILAFSSGHGILAFSSIPLSLFEFSLDSIVLHNDSVVLVCSSCLETKQSSYCVANKFIIVIFELK